MGILAIRERGAGRVRDRALPRSEEERWQGLKRGATPRTEYTRKTLETPWCYI